MGLSLDLLKGKKKNYREALLNVLSWQLSHSGPIIKSFWQFCTITNCSLKIVGSKIGLSHKTTEDASYWKKREKRLENCHQQGIHCYIEINILLTSQFFNLFFSIWSKKGIGFHYQLITEQKQEKNTHVQTSKLFKQVQRGLNNRGHCHMQ